MVEVKICGLSTIETVETAIDGGADFVGLIFYPPSPRNLTFEEAVRMLSEKKEKEAQKIIKQFPENPDMQILNGRYGPYIAYQKKNYKIPENVNPADLNLDACFKVIELQAQKAEMRKAKGAKAKTKK